MSPRTTSPRVRRPRLLVAALAGLTVSGVLVAVAPSATAATSDRLLAGATLASGASLVSADGSHTLTMRADGDLVLRDAGGTTWETRTSQAGSRLVMQTDGNAVVYTPTNTPVWSSQTAGKGANRLVVANSGDLALLSAPGALVWHTDTAVEPKPTSIGSSVPVNSPLTPLRYLTSPSGAVTARFSDDGSFVVRTASQVLWTAQAGAQPGVRFIVQTDGNIVLYSASRALWSTGTHASDAARLTVQDDGNLVAYTTTGRAYWASRSSLPKPPTAGADRLLRGQSLAPGQSLVAGNKAYRLSQQTDGNLVLYGPSGPTWYTNTGGFGAVHSGLQSDGNFVVSSGAGAALWSSRTSGGVQVVLQSDGNLVVYSSTNRALWASRSSAKPPPLFPPQTSPPPTATSRYLRNLRGGAADLTFMRSAGCTDARNVPNGERYLTFLAFGAQASNVQGTWGVQLTASTIRITNAAVVAAVESYVDGYRSCMKPYSALTVAVGTNNDGEDAGLGSTGGAVWADQVIDPLVAYAAPGGRVTIAAANDIEPGFAGNATQAVSWMRGYLAASSAPFVNTGSADGCPQTLGSTLPCNYGWTPRVLYDLTYGLMPTRALPLVQIYFTSMAKQWANISLVGGNATGRRMTFAGPLTEVTACAQASSCYSMAPTTAWQTLWNQLKADPRTAISDLQYTTDLRIDR